MSKEKKDKKEMKKAVWRKSWRLMGPFQNRIKILWIFIMIFEATRMIGPYILKLIIDELTNFSPEKIGAIFSLIILMFFVNQSVSFIHFLKDRRIFKLLTDVYFYLPTKAQEKLVSLSLGYHEREDTGNKIIKIERGINKIVDFGISILWEVGPALIKFLITLVVLVWVDWLFGIIFLFFSFLFIVTTYKANKSLRPIRKQRHKNYEIAGGKMTQSIFNINTVKSFVQEKRELKEYKNIKEKIRETELGEWYFMLRISLFRNFALDAGIISILSLGTYLVWKDNMTIGTLIFVSTLSEKAFSSLFRLSRFYDRLEEGAEAVNRFTELVDEDIDIKNPKNGIKPKKLKGDIEFEKLNFAYDDADNQALKNVSFKIKAGDMVAFVGPSGGGKTTLARMIYRHYDPQKGRVLLDGKDLRKYDLFSFRKSMAIVPQEVDIFNLSVKENIAYANPKATMKEIEHAAKIANAKEFIDNLPEKYNTLVGERGVKLSGGQRQRIGIARAILADPKILIFDEATSSLDSYSERLIQEAMDRVAKDRTTILIAHRLSTIKKANKIIVLENGRLVEKGSHKELAKAKGGLYAKLLSLQKMGDVE